MIALFIVSICVAGMALAVLTVAAVLVWEEKTNADLIEENQEPTALLGVVLPKKEEN